MKHPDLEQVAAFAEGRLTGEDRERMVEHLASCDDCHELLVETVELLRPEADGAVDGTDIDDRVAGAGGGAAVPGDPGTVLRPPRSRWRRGLPLVAAVAAAALIAFLVWTPAVRDFLRGVRHASLHLPYPPSELVHPLDGGEVLAALERPAADWNETLGPSATVSHGQAAAFRLGVHNAELAAALALLEGNEPGGAAAARAAARQRAGRILAALGPDVGALVRNLYGELMADLEAGSPAADLRDLHDRADRNLAPDPEVDSPGFVDGDYYALGKWAGAARLAVDGDRPGWFRYPLPRSQLEALTGTTFPERIAAPLEEVAEVLDAAPADPDLPRLRAALDRLLREAGEGDAPLAPAPALR